MLRCFPKFRPTILAAPIVVAIAVGFTSSSVWALSGAATAECLGTQHVVSVDGIYTHGWSPEVVGVVFRREAVGSCEPASLVPQEPIPIELNDCSGSYCSFRISATVEAPSTDLNYRYTPYGVRLDGTLAKFYTDCGADGRTYAITECAEVPIAVGVLSFQMGCSGSFGICLIVQVCPGQCWPDNFYVHLDGPTEIEFDRPVGDLLGELVVVYGGRTYCGLPGSPPYTATRINLAPASACTPVSTSTGSWGSLKIKAGAHRD